MQLCHVCVPTVLYVYFYNAPPHPHSFPTRRSSDLPRRTFLPLPTSIYSQLLPVGRAGPACCGNVEEPAATFDRRYRADRKSTRLNSSHGYISYAVFCLKKKMTNRYVNRTFPFERRR